MITNIPRHKPEEILDSTEIKVGTFDGLYKRGNPLGTLYNYHRTTFYHIFLYKGNDNFHHFENKKIRLDNNSLLVINQDILHKFSVRQCRGEMILFSTAFFGSSEEKSNFLNHCLLFRNDYAVIKPLSDDFIACVESYFSLMKIQTGKGQATELSLLRNWLHNLLMIIDREYRLQKKWLDIPDKKDYMHEVQKFRFLLDMHYRTQKQVCFYAERLNLSEKKLSTFVFSVYGISAKEYISEKVLSEAIRLLKNTTHTQGEIANELGFDFTYFVKFFRKRTGITPAKYRRQEEISYSNKNA
jgi:AraC-like DNA-binding protein